MPQHSKVAICGTGGHLELIKYYSGEVWCVSKGYKKLLPRDGRDPADRVFELHAPKSYERLKQVSVPIVLACPHPDFPDAIILPKEELLAEYGQYFHSSIAWMMGMALREGVDSLALLGVHMMLKTEYGAQRDDIFYFIGIAKARGINVFIPPDSHLVRGKKLYGYKV